MKILSLHSKHIMRENKIEKEDLLLYDFFDDKKIYNGIILSFDK